MWMKFTRTKIKISEMCTENRPEACNIYSIDSFSSGSNDFYGLFLVFFNVR